MTEVSEEALSLAGTMELEMLRLKESLDFSENRVKEGFFFELRDMVFSFAEVVSKAVGMLKYQGVVEEQLFRARQSLQLQVASNRRLLEDKTQLETQLRETSNDYGQLLVGLDTKDETLKFKLLGKRAALLDKSGETAAVDGCCDPPLESNEATLDNTDLPFCCVNSFKGNRCRASPEGSTTCEPLLTSADVKPPNCSECGKCRINSDRSFHCDNCGVCLDIQLCGTHVCREDSAHDPCCICLQDAFSGYQILPCGHKIHKDCATSVIRNGMRHCPVCGQSFAYPQQRL